MQSEDEALRREYLARLVHGERLSVDDFLAGRSGIDESVRDELLASARRRGLDPAAVPDGGDRLGPFRLVRHLGGGGQATVWLAEDTRFGAGHRLVALKIFVGGADFGASGAPPDSLQRARREASVLARLDDDAIATILDAGADATRTWIAMRYVEGETLAQHIAIGDPSLRNPEIAGAIIERIARAMHVAHEAGILHRDLKPSNIMLRGDGRPVLVDFGLARDDTADSTLLTRGGGTPGTLAYVAPEVLAHGSVAADRRGDVYALGLTLYECLAGRRAFQHDTPGEVTRAVAAGAFPSLERLRRDVPADLRIVVTKAMDLDPGRRYANAAEFADDLARARAGQPIVARAPSLRHRCARALRRRRGWIAIAAALMLAGITFWRLAENFATRKLGADLLAASSVSLAEHDATLSLLLAIEGAERSARPVNDPLLRALDGLQETRSVMAHVGRICDCEPIPGTGLFASGGRDGAIRIFAADSLEEVRVLQKSGPEVSTLAASPDGRYLAAGFFTMEARLWSLADDKRRERDSPLLRVETTYHHVGSFDASGSRWLTIDPQHHPSLRGLPGGEEVCSFHEETALSAAALAPDGAHAAGCGKDGGLLCFECRSGAATVMFEVPGEFTRCSFVAGGERVLAVPRSGPAMLIDAKSGNVMPIQAIADARGGSAESPDGQRLFLASSQRTAVIVDSRSGELLRSLQTEERLFGECVFARDGDALLCAERNLAFLFEGVRSDAVARFGGHVDTAVPAFVCAEGRFAVSGDDTGRLRRFAFDDGRRMRMIRESDAQWLAIDASPSGDCLALVSTDRRAHLYEVATKRFIDLELPSGWASLSCVQFSPDGRTLAIAVGNQCASCLVDASDGRLLRVLTNSARITNRGFDAWVTGLAFDPSGRRVVTVAGDGAARVFDVDTGEQLRALVDRQIEPQSLGSVAWRSDGERVVITSAVRSDGRVFIFDPSTGREQMRVRAHGDWMPVTALFAAGGERIYVACEDGALREFDARDTQAMRDVDGREPPLRTVQLPAGSGFISGLALCAGGKLLAAGTGNGHIALFDTKSWELLARHAIAGSLIHVALWKCVDGERIACASEDGRVRWIDVDPLSRARELAPRGLTSDENRLFGIRD